MHHDTHLLPKLEQYSKSGSYPFHMPGHKRRNLDFPNPWTVDLTEIEGFDNLHHAEGILQALQERAAALFAAEKSFCLINGSTCGILAAISACVRPGGTILMARNCHKSAYHAVFLRSLTPVYLQSEATDFGICGPITPQSVADALQKHSDIQAVLLVSPTYDGIVSDIASIAAIVHARNIPLIVDEAHGAHFPFSSQFPSSALSCGADLVIHSLHKTLPAFTQTALLHLNSQRIEEARLRHYLELYQSSSPSYLLLASIDYCLDFLKSHGERLFEELAEKLNHFYMKAQAWRSIEVMPPAPNKDYSKLLISAARLGLSGVALSDLLRKDYKLELEMAAGHYVLALTTLLDETEGFLRLEAALEQIDQLSLHPRCKSADMDSNRMYFSLPPQVMTPAQALESETRIIPLTQAQGCVSQEYLYLYPPGIPLLVPGEQIEEALLRQIQQIQTLGLPLEGLSDHTNQQIAVVAYRGN